MTGMPLSLPNEKGGNCSQPESSEAVQHYTSSRIQRTRLRLGCEPRIWPGYGLITHQNPTANAREMWLVSQEFGCPILHGCPVGRLIKSPGVIASTSLASCKCYSQWTLWNPERCCLASNRKIKRRNNDLAGGDWFLHKGGLPNLANQVCSQTRQQNII